MEYRHVPPKLIITTIWRVLCVDLVGPYTLKGKDGSSIDFMCLTMIGPTTSWFEMVEFPNVRVTVPKAGVGMLTAGLQGIQPCKCKEKRHQ